MNQDAGYGGSNAAVINQIALAHYRLDDANSKAIEARYRWVVPAFIGRVKEKQMLYIRGPQNPDLCPPVLTKLLAVLSRWQRHLFRSVYRKDQL